CFVLSVTSLAVSFAFSATSLATSFVFSVTSWAISFVFSVTSFVNFVVESTAFFVKSALLSFKSAPTSRAFSVYSPVFSWTVSFHSSALSSAFFVPLLISRRKSSPGFGASNNAVTAPTALPINAPNKKPFPLLSICTPSYLSRFFHTFKIAELHFTASVALPTSSSSLRLCDNFLIEPVKLLNESPISSTPSNTLFNLATLYLTSSASSFVF